MLVKETISFQRYKDPKEALGLSAVFHADDILFAERYEDVYASNIYKFHNHPEKQLIKCFKKFSYLNIKVSKGNIDYTLEHLYDDGYRYIEYNGIMLDMTEKLD